MEPDDLNFADVDELTDALDAVGVKATMDPNLVPVPGVWVRFTGLGTGPLNGCAVRLTLFPVVAKATKASDSLKALADLWNLIRPVVREYGGPNGDVTATGLTLPSSPVALPALAVPLELITVQEGEA